jgi:hypothetical protein
MTRYNHVSAIEIPQEQEFNCGFVVLFLLTITPFTIWCSTEHSHILNIAMAIQGFYLVGDEINTARHIPLSQIEDLASLKKKLADFFNIVGKQGTINLNNDS